MLDALDACGLDDRTRVIYTSDHGETLGDYGLWGKSVMYDSAVAVPLILAGPDVPAGAVRDVSVSLVDAFPTICEGVGVPLEAADADLPGTSAVAAGARRGTGNAHHVRRISRQRLGVGRVHAAR